MVCAALYNTVQRIRGTMDRNPRSKTHACRSSRGRTSAQFDSLQRSLRGPRAKIDHLQPSDAFQRQTDPPLCPVSRQRRSCPTRSLIPSRGNRRLPRRLRPKPRAMPQSPNRQPLQKRIRCRASCRERRLTDPRTPRSHLQRRLPRRTHTRCRPLRLQSRAHERLRPCPRRPILPT